MNKTFLKLVLFLLIPFQLFIFTFLVPPFQKPDEQPHFEKSLLFSKGYIFCDKKINNIVKLEKKYVDLIKTPYLDLLTHGKSKLPTKVFLKDLFANNQSNTLVDFNVDQLCSFPVISYLPQAFTLIILTLVNINPIQSIYFVRLAMGVLCYFWFLYLYKKINHHYKLILLFTFTLPMTLHQVSSFSYDALHIMFGLTFFVLLINTWIPAGACPRLRSGAGMTQTTKKYFNLFSILFLFLASKKIGYETFFLFLFLIPIEVKPMIMSSLVFIPFYILSKLTGSFDLQASLTNTAINPLQQINFLISNPLNIFSILISTSINRFPFYLQSLIGIFGWLEYGLDPVSYILYGLFFIYVIVETRHALSLHKNKTILLFAILIFSYIFIILLAFVFNTSPGTQIAHGVQGRYFIPFVPFIILLITQFTQKIKFPKLKISKWILNIIYISTILYLTSATFWSVYNRYY